LETSDFRQAPSGAPAPAREDDRRGRGSGGGKVLVLFLCFLAFRVVCLWDAGLSGHDDPRVAGIAREMLLDRDFVIPRLNGEPFLEYPPFGYLPVALFLKASGRPPDWLATLPSAFLGAATACLTFLLGRRMAGERVGLLASLVLSTSAGFVVLHRRCVVDPTLLFCITLSLWGFQAGWAGEGKKFRYYAVFYLAMGFGFLSKGLIGAAIPAVVALSYLIARRELSSLRGLRLHWGGLLFALPILAWACAAAWRDGPGPLREVIEQSFSRFRSPLADHAQSSLYYLPHAFLNLLPWIALPAVHLLRRARGGGWRRLFANPLFPLALSWLLVVLTGLSLASAKRVLYLAPLYPAFALLSALLWDRAAAAAPLLRRFEVPVSLLAVLTFGVLNFVLFLPEGRREAFRPLFDVAKSQGKDQRIYLYNPNEALRGAAVFYLGRTVPVLTGGKPLEESLAEVAGLPEKVLIVALPRAEGDDSIVASLSAGNFHEIGRRLVPGGWVEVFSNASPPGT